MTRGAASDQSEAAFTLMERPQNIRVERICPGTSSIRLTWDAVPNATGYDVFLLGSRYMDSVGTSNTTTFDVPVADVTAEQWFSVRAIGANGLRSQRQIAVQFSGSVGGNPVCLLACSGDNDAGVSGITSPSASIQDCAGTTRPVSVSLENLGLFTETNFPIYYQLNNDPVVQEVFSSNIAPSGNATYTFTNLLNVPPAGNHILRIWTGLATDSTKCNDTLTLPLTVFVPTGNLPIIEDYESGVFPPTQAFIENPDGGFTWASASVTGSDGLPTAAMFVNNYVYNNSGAEDYFEFRAIDLSTPIAGAGALMTFDVAHRPYNTTLTDILRVEVSTDCGATYTSVYNKGGMTLATAGTTTANWSPNTSGDWRNDTVDLSTYVGNVVLLRFVNETAYGNNTFVDNVNLALTGVLPPAAAFRSNKQYTCDGTIAFVDQSANQPVQWLWNFGDGDTSNVQNPTHTYTQSGRFNVTLRVTNGLGQDIEVRNAYIDVELAEVTTTTDGMACPNVGMNLSATSAGGDLYWYDSTQALVHIGPTFAAPASANTTDYQVQNIVTTPLQAAGPLSPTAVGSGGYHGSGFYGIINFTAFRAFDIVSVWVDADGTGPRTIALWDGNIASGAAAPTNPVLQTTTVNLSGGRQRVQLDFVVPGPGEYSIGGNNMDLFRNNNGVSYPYTLPSVLSMTSSSAGNAANFYYYFYDWRVRLDSCVSPLETVTAEVVEADFTSVLSGGTAAFSDASTGATSWSWDFGDGDTSNVQNPTHTYSTPGPHLVTLTINNGACSYSDTVELSISVTELNGGMELVLLPNPATSSTNLRFGQPLEQPLRLTLLSASGQVILETELPQGSTDHALDVSDLPAAVYWIRLQNDRLVETRKLIVRD